MHGWMKISRGLLPCVLAYIIGETTNGLQERSNKMKKRFLATLMVGVMSITTLVGCGGATTEAPAKQEETTKVVAEATTEQYFADEDFMVALAKGLEARWEITNYNSDLEIEIGTDAYYKKLVESEYQYVSKFADVEFKDDTLKDYVKEYIACLEKQDKAMDYSINGQYEECDRLWEEARNDRTLIIKHLVEDYGLTVSERYIETLNEIVNNGGITEETKEKEEAIKKLLTELRFDFEHEYDSYECDKFIKNDTGYDYNDVSFDLVFYKNDEVVDMYTEYISDFKNGANEKISAYTYEEFDFVSVENIVVYN